MSNKLKKKASTRLSPELMTAAEVSGITVSLRKTGVLGRMQASLEE